MQVLIKLLIGILMVGLLVGTVSAVGYTKISPIMTNDTTPSGNTTTASSVLYGQTAPYGAWTAFDGVLVNNSDGVWIANNVKTGYLTIEMPTANIVRQYKLYAYFFEDSAPKNWTFSGSNNTTTWTTLDTQTNSVDWGSRGTKTFEISNTNNFTNYNLSISANNGNDYVAVAELEIFKLTYVPPNATVPQFSANVTNGMSNLNVSFTDSSTQTPTDWDWYWFANETKSSDLQNPTTTFTPGSYDVRLYASNAGGGSWENKSNFITSKVYYLGFGDSITAGDDKYVIKMRDLYNGSASAYGAGVGGLASDDGWDIIPYNDYGVIEYVMFGANDRANAYTAATTIDETTKIYDYLVTQGVTPYLLVATLMANGSFSAGTSVDQADNITTIEAAYTANGTPFIKMYDAIDSIPCNGVPDQINATLLNPDGIHPTAEAQTIMAKYLWNQTDYCLGAITPVASFTKSKTLVVFPSTVTLNDTSINTPTSWSWDMGDGRAAITDQNLTYQYLKRGLYKVNLSATNAAGTDYDTQYVWVWGFSGGQQMGVPYRDTSLMVNIDEGTFTSSRTLSDIEKMKVLCQMYNYGQECYLG